MYVHKLFTFSQVVAEQQYTNEILWTLAHIHFGISGVNSLIRR